MNANKAFLRYVMIAIAVMQVALCLCCSHAESRKDLSRRNIATLLDKAESLLGTDDSTALATLKDINATAMRSRKHQARYALLYSEALYKNYITAPSDSLIMTAVRYYSSTNDAEHQFRAFYMLGCIYDELGQTTDAAVALGQAEQIADNITDDYRLGLFFSQFGDIFFKSFDFERALHYYELAYEHFQLAPKKRHTMHALYDIGRCQLQMGNNLSAYQIFLDVEKKADLRSDKNLIYNSLTGQLSASLEMNDTAWSSASRDKLTRTFNTWELDAFANTLLARYCIIMGHPVEAYQYIQTGWEKAGTPSDSIKLYLCESQLEEMNSTNNKALNNYKQAIYLQHRNLYQLQHKPALGAIKDYYKEVAYTESLIASRKQVQIVLISFIFVVSVIVMMAVVRYKRIQSKARLNELNVVIDSLRLKENTSNTTNNELNARINMLFGSTYAKLDGIFAELLETEMYLEAYKNRSGQNEQKAGKTQQDELYQKIQNCFNEFVSDKYQTHLDEIINTTYNGILERLSGINLKKKELQILRLSIAGFSPKTISYILGIPTKTLYQNRSRILKKIEGINPQTHSELCNILRIKGINK